MRHHQLKAEEDYQSRVLYEICSLIHHTLKFPHLPYPFPFTTTPAASSSSKSQPWWTMLSWAAATSSQDSPAAFASMFLGISLALMLFGSATFLVGFIMLPWVTLLVVVFCVASLVSNLSMLLSRLILGSTTLHKYSFSYEARKFLKL